MINITSGADLTERNFIKPTQGNWKYFYHDALIFTPRKTEQFFIAFADERKLLTVGERLRFPAVNLEVKV